MLRRCIKSIVEQYSQVNYFKDFHFIFFNHHFLHTNNSWSFKIFSSKFVLFYCWIYFILGIIFHIMLSHSESDGWSVFDHLNFLRVIPLWTCVYLLISITTNKKGTNIYTRITVFKLIYFILYPQNYLYSIFVCNTVTKLFCVIYIYSI